MRQISPVLVFFGLLAATTTVYWPGLGGSFLFDDFANLPALGAYGGVDNLETLLLYVSGGIAGPSGRPLSLLTFLIDANNWPASPWSFKYTNLLIHLLNGVLLCWLSILLARALGYAREHAQWIGLLCAGLWMLHPLWVSTTLYVVQRMTLLAATFMLAGLLAYVHGRVRLNAGQRRGYLWMTAGISLGTVLATLSKENGILLPLLALIVEWIVLAPLTQASSLSPRSIRLFRLWKLAFLVMPTLLVFGYVALRLPGIIEHTPEIRTFTLGERLLTELRIVVDYLRQLFVPQPYTSALFHDNMTLSTGLLQPWTTLASGLFLGALAVVGWISRRRCPPLALAVFFFFAGHLLESTVLPLELYFEHRNYAPAMFAFFPLAVWFVSAGSWRAVYRVGTAVLVLGIFASMTYARSDVWGKPVVQAMLWAQQNPNSPRALTIAAIIHKQQGHYRAARQLLEAADKVKRYSIMAGLNGLALACETGTVNPQSIRRAQRALRHDERAEDLAFNIIGDFISELDTDYCPAVDAARLKQLIAAALANPAIANTDGRRQSMLQLYGLLALKQHRPMSAYQQFSRALRARPKPDVALIQAARLGTAGEPCLGLRILQLHEALAATTPKTSGLGMQTLHTWILDWLNYYPEEIARMRSVLHEDALERAMTCQDIHKQAQAGGR